MQSQLSCPLCNFEYGEQKTPRILSMCGHTFCETCIQTMILPAGQDKFKIICPEDDATAELQNNNLKQFPVNKALLKIIDSNKSKSSFKDSSFDVSKIVKQQELQEDQETKELICAIKQSQQQELQANQKSENTNGTNNNTQINNSTANTVSKKQADPKKQESEESEEDDNICLLHQKPLEVVCVVDLEKICAKCAIFGKHKGHQFKSVQQIQQQNNAFYHDLLAVYDDKTEIMTRVQKKETKADLLAILNANKQNLTKQIRERFKKLIDAIKSQQKKSLTKLQKIAQKIEKDIDDLYSIEPTLIQKYQEWERHSFDKLQIIQKGTFEQKLELLLVDQAVKEKNITVQGKLLVDKIKAQQDSIINKAEILLTNMNMKTNDKVFQFVQSFVQVFDKPPEPPKPQPVKVQPPVVYTREKDVLIYDSGKKHSEDDLLQIDQQMEDPIKQQRIEVMSKQPRTAKKEQLFKSQQIKYTPILENRLFEQKSIMRQQVKPQVRKNPQFSNTVEDLKRKVQMTQEIAFQNTSKQDNFVSEKLIRPTKKKLKTIKVPQKYEKALETLYADSSETLDLTNAQLGDNVILQICEFIPGTKLKTVKFIRNKLTDDCIVKMLPFITNVITLNLSQNLLTERVLDIFIQHRDMLPKMKNIILSLNKIIQRKHKPKIDELRKLDITVSV